MKKYQASPVTVTKFDADGQALSQETFVPEKKRSREQYGDVVYHWKVVGRMQDGSIKHLSYAQDEESALDIASEQLDSNPQVVSAWHERI